MKIMIRLLLFAIITTAYSSCKNNPIGPAPPLGENAALYLSLDGGTNMAGIWVLNADSLRLIDSLGTGPGVPFTIEFSTHYAELYSIWQASDRRSFLFAVDNKSLSILQKVLISPPRPFVVLDKINDILIAYASSPMMFYDRSRLNLIWEDTSSAVIWEVQPSNSGSNLYMTRDDGTMFTGLTIFDIKSHEIKKTIPVAEAARQKIMEPADLAISPDEHYAFLSVFNWQGLGGYNSFFVVDLTQSKVVDEYATGAFAQLCVSPDGRYVYISDPAGYLYMMHASNEMLRYDISARSMEIFVSLGGLGLSGNLLVSDRMAMASDNRTLFVSVSGDVKDSGGKWVDLLKIDVVTRSILKTFSLPLDSFGRRTQMIRNVRVGLRAQ